MRLFLITPSQWVASNAILHQKVIDLVEAGVPIAQLHIYIVGDPIPSTIVDHFRHLDQVRFLSTSQAEKLITEVTNAKVLHFGNTLKGSATFPQYFLPLSHPGLVTNPSFFKRIQQRFQFQRWLRKATAVYVTNDWALKSLQKQFPQYTSSFKQVYLPSQPIPHFEWHQLCAVRDMLTNGTNYFLCYTQVDYFVALLKEFSIFKKWQKTTMALVVILSTSQQVAAAKLLLKGYRYKDAIVLKHAEKLDMDWVAGAYALVLDHIDFDLTASMEWAVQSDVPVLLNEASLPPTAWINAGEVFMFSENLALSNHFKLYYKDEVYRQSRARMGKEWLASFVQNQAEQGLPNLLNDLAS
jgi:hypothetical protein